MKPKTPPKWEIKQVDYLREMKEKKMKDDDADYNERMA